VEGLVLAAHAWDQTRGCEFAVYAKYRILGTIKDWQRTTTVASSPRGRNRELRKKGLPETKQTRVSLDAALSLGVVDQRFGALEDRLTLEMVMRDARLNRAQRFVIAGLLDERVLSELGEALGVNESRACQIKAEAIRLMKATVTRIGPRHARRIGPKRVQTAQPQRAPARDPRLPREPGEDSEEDIPF